MKYECQTMEQLSKVFAKQTKKVSEIEHVVTVTSMLGYFYYIRDYRYSVGWPLMAYKLLIKWLC
jgi:hypothetical protein